jgi:hypothetical protein
LEEVAEQFFGDRGFNGASGVFQHAIVDWDYSRIELNKIKHGWGNKVVILNFLYREKLQLFFIPEIQCIPRNNVEATNPTPNRFQSFGRMSNISTKFRWNCVSCLSLCNCIIWDYNDKCNV